MTLPVRTRRGVASGVVFVVAAVVLAGLPAASLPGPGSDDAGTGTDAPDARIVGIPIPAGTHQANLTQNRDSRDVYRLDPPPSSIVRVHVDAPGRWQDPEVTAVSVELKTDYGSRETWTRPPGYNVSISAPRGDPVTMTADLQNSTVRDPRQARRVGYEFTVTYERHRFFAPLQGGPGNASAWRVHFPEGSYGRVEYYFGYPLRPTARGDQETLDYGRWFANPDQAKGILGRCWGGMAHTTWGTWYSRQVATGSAGLDGNAPVWTEGLPRDVAGGPPDLAPDDGRVEQGDILVYRQLEDRDGNFSAHLGAAGTLEIPVKGWVVWDDPSLDPITNASAQARFLDLGDFDGGGPAVRAGPVAYARNLSTTVRVPAGDPSMDVLVVDATTPRINNVMKSPSAPTRMDVTAPNGTRWTLEDEPGAWLTEARDWWGITEDRGTAPAGPWEIHLQQTQGWESDRIRVIRVHFDLAGDCDR